MDRRDAAQPTWTDLLPDGPYEIAERGAWLTVPLVGGMTETEATALSRALAPRKPGEPVIMRRLDPPADGWRYYRAEQDGATARILGSLDGVYWVPLTTE